MPFVVCLDINEIDCLNTEYKRYEFPHVRSQSPPRTRQHVEAAKHHACEETIGLTQPAVSAALARLRDTLGDPLFVRQGNSLVPTSFALGLQDTVRNALMQIEAVLSNAGSFNPAMSTKNFGLGGSDYFNELLMPELADRVMQTAPGVRLKLLPADISELPQLLSTERFDMILLIPSEVPDWIDRATAFHSSFVVAVRNQHPRLGSGLVTDGERLSVDQFCAEPHAVFAVKEDFPRSEDQALAQLGRKRHILASVSGFHGVASVVAKSDLIGVLPTRFALSVARGLGLQLYRLPFDMPLMQLSLYWHKRETSNGEHAWMRNQILNILAPLDELQSPIGEDAFPVNLR